MPVIFDTKILITEKELGNILSVSDATVKNWIRLNKIHPTQIQGKSAYFTKEYANQLLKIIKSENSNILKSRRNKKYKTGASFYKNYLSDTSQNSKIITELSDYIKEAKADLTENKINYIIADCTVQLFLQRKNITTDIKTNFLKEYLDGKIELGKYNELIDNLIDNKEKALTFIENNPDIFARKYIYEKNGDILGLLYISLSDIKNRKARGAYYTPTKIIKKAINNADFKNFENKTVIDPCCGAGNFLLHIPDGINILQIFGNDIDATAIKITRINMALKYLPEDINILYKNFSVKNFLTTDNKDKFDYIIGNPPWGAEFTQDEIKGFKNKYITAKGKNIESYDLFVEKALSSLKQDGHLLFVLPEAILTVKNHKEIRDIILKNNSVEYIDYLGNIFDKVQCPVITIKIHHTNLPLLTIGTKVTDKNKSFVIKTERHLTKDGFNFNMDDEEYSIFNKLFGGETVYLKNNAVFAMGIVTGNNKKFITDKKNSKNEVILKGSDIEKFKINEPDRYIEYIPKNFQQAAPTEIYRTKEKLLYKFVSSKLAFAYDNKQRLTLNSCNILIPKITGLDIKYIMAILNSRIAQFIFEKKYNSVKVLRSHLESIPIPVCDGITQDKIIQTVNKIMNNNNLYDELDRVISELYGLTEHEYLILKNAIK